MYCFTRRYLTQRIEVNRTKKRARLVQNIIYLENRKLEESQQAKVEARLF